MVIVAGHITVEPQQRESYLADCVSVVEQARRAAGCLDFAITADLVDPGRVNIFERWESQAAVETFRSSGPSDDQSAAMLSASVAEYDIAGVRSLYSGKTQHEPAARTVPRPMRSVRPGPTERRPDEREGNTIVLSGDVAAAVSEPRAKPGRELQVHGSRTLIRWLLDNNLVDELNLLTFPVVVGQGTRLFPDTGQDTALELVESRATPSGVTIQIYRPTGRPQYGTATADMKHVTR